MPAGPQSKTGENMLEGVGWGRECEGKLVGLLVFAEPTCSLALGWNSG